MWLDGVVRTTSAELAGLIRASELAVARHEGAIVGCVRVQWQDNYRGEFGMLAASPLLGQTQAALSIAADVAHDAA